MLTLAIGDLFIPDRALDLPSKFKKLLSPSPNTIPSNTKISQVICLGNITNSIETLKFLYNLSPLFNIVKGEYDDIQILQQQLSALGKTPSVIPSYDVISHDNIRIGFTSGYQLVPRHDDMALLNLARELDVDILIWGGGYNKVEAYAIEGKFFINPGSASGSYTFSEGAETAEKESDLPDVSEVTTTKTEEGEVTNSDKKENEDEGPEDEKKNDNSEVKTDLFGDESSKTDIDSNELDLEILEKVSGLTEITPSFCLLDTNRSTCTLYIYTYVGGEVKVDKVTYEKE